MTTEEQKSKAYDYCMNGCPEMPDDVWQTIRAALSPSEPVQKIDGMPKEIWCALTPPDQTGEFWLIDKHPVEGRVKYVLAPSEPVAQVWDGKIHNYHREAVLREIGFDVGMTDKPFQQHVISCHGLRI